MSNLVPGWWPRTSVVWTFRFDTHTHTYTHMQTHIHIHCLTLTYTPTHCHTQTCIHTHTYTPLNSNICVYFALWIGHGKVQVQEYLWRLDVLICFSSQKAVIVRLINLFWTWNLPWPSAFHYVGLSFCMSFCLCSVCVLSELCVTGDSKSDPGDGGDRREAELAWQLEFSLCGQTQHWGGGGQGQQHGPNVL